MTSIKQIFSTKKARWGCGLLAAYIFMVQLNMQAESMGYSWYKNVMERELLTTIDPISGACDIGSPTTDGNPSPEGSTKTL